MGHTMKTAISGISGRRRTQREPRKSWLSHGRCDVDVEYGYMLNLRTTTSRGWSMLVYSLISVQTERERERDAAATKYIYIINAAFLYIMQCFVHTYIAISRSKLYIHVIHGFRMLRGWIARHCLSLLEESLGWLS